MKLRRDWRTFRSLGAERRRLIVEAAALTGVVWLGLRILPLVRLRGILDAWAERAVPGPQIPAAAIGWAVTAVANRSAARTCLIQALTADAMLRRRRHESLFQLGVRKTEDRLRPLDGHAWVECNGVIVVGQLEDLATYSGAVWTATAPFPVD